MRCAVCPLLKQVQIQQMDKRLVILCPVKIGVLVERFICLTVYEARRVQLPLSPPFEREARTYIWDGCSHS